MMAYRKSAFAFALALALAAVGCTEENPTDVGDVLLPSDAVITFEVVLPASAFLVDDSSFSGYNHPQDAGFGLIARSFENVVDANTLVRFTLPPSLITVRVGTTTAIDSLPFFPRGRMVVKLDTVTATPRPIHFSLYRIAEQWDRSATWTERVDSGDISLPWAMPGGTRGALIDTATWTTGDSISFNVDSTTLAIWRDTSDHARGAILVAETPGSRGHVLSMAVRVATRSTLRPDTVLNVDLVPIDRTFIFNPTLSSPFSGIRAGGIPTWRSFLRFREDIRSLRIPCTGGPAGCEVALADVHINRAQLLLKPARTAAGFSPEDSIFVEIRPISTTPQVPLERSAIGAFFPQVLSELLPPTLFTDPAETDVVRLDITGFMTHQMDESITPGNRFPLVLALLQIPEVATFGFATFEEAPMLRLILTTTVEGR
ncbi:MAG: hypothetical protein ACT4O1_01935 [Gemmatimonadota bacterium]